ncbi:hypothetical protein D3C81_2022030 [compost metagenome]
MKKHIYCNQYDDKSYALEKMTSWDIRFCMVSELTRVNISTRNDSICTCYDFELFVDFALRDE